MIKIIEPKFLFLDDDLITPIIAVDQVAFVEQIRPMKDKENIWKCKIHLKDQEIVFTRIEYVVIKRQLSTFCVDENMSAQEAAMLI